MTGLLARFLLLLVAFLPRRLSQFLGRMAGHIHALLGTRAARVTQANLELCLPKAPDLRGMTRQSLIETGKTLMETPAVWFGDLARIDQWIGEVHNESLLQQKLQARQGLLVLLPHLGNWELFNVFFRRYGQMTALYQPPRQAFMKSVMREVRGRHGNIMVPTTRAGLKQLYKTLEQGGTVVVLPDQVPASGIFAPFFGQQALTDVLASRLLARTGARALGIAMVRSADGRFDVHITEPEASIYEADELTSITAVNALVQTSVMLAPAQYQWEYKRFRERPAGEKKIYRFDKPPGVH